MAYQTLEELSNQLYNNKSCTDFSAISLDIRSINKNFDYLTDILNSINPKIRIDFISITESWVTPNNPLPSLKNYKSLATNRPYGRGGGIALYTLYDQSATEIFDIKFMLPSIESLFIKTENKIIGTIYRPPNGNKTEFFKFLEQILEFTTVYKYKPAHLYSRGL